MLAPNKKLLCIATLLLWLIVNDAKAQTATDSLPKAKWQNDGYGFEIGSHRIPHFWKRSSYQKFSDFVADESLLPYMPHDSVRLTRSSHHNSDATYIGYFKSYKKPISDLWQTQLKGGIGLIPYFSIIAIEGSDTLGVINGATHAVYYNYSVLSTYLLVNGSYLINYNYCDKVNIFGGIDLTVGQSFFNGVELHNYSRIGIGDSTISSSEVRGNIPAQPVLYVGVCIPVGIDVKIYKGMRIFFQKEFKKGMQYVYGRRPFYLPFGGVQQFTIGVRFRAG